MAKSSTNPKVDWFFDKDTRWKKEYAKLRAIALESGLTETLKWGCPCYTLDKSNIVLIHGFKEYCAYLFFKGAIMADPDDILIQQTQNVQSARQIRFTSAAQITKMKAALKKYIREAIAVEASGQKVEFRKTAEFNMPEEFQARLSKNRALENAFYGLTPGRQRGYLLYFSSARKAETREARIDKYTKQILAGKGLED
jgi:uncharacterized protein YdeI (YjbR/CyaY-like superfamily)